MKQASLIKPIIVIIGTRAEAIKLIPLYLALKKSGLNTLLCATFQHFELLEQVCSIFQVTPDFQLNVMKKDQDLFYLTQIILERTKQIYLQTNPSLVIVQGDTTTTLASALAAFYLHIPVAHVEAGLRTGNMQAPFPEEMNRKVVGQFAQLHFAPTAFSTANLLAEGIKRENVFCTGNTIVDALNFIQEKITTDQIKVDQKLQKQVESCKRNKQKIVLLTAHRRESFDGGLTRVFSSMKQFVQNHPDVTIFFPVHPNPNVARAIDEAGIRDESKIIFLEPLSYANLIYLLTQSDWVASDSGGLQEEAVSLGKRILVLRDITERWEGVWEGTEVLVGTNPDLILENMENLYHMTDRALPPSTVYGDGKACDKIVRILKNKVNNLQIYEKNQHPRSRVHRPTNSSDSSNTQL